MFIKNYIRLFSLDYPKILAINWEVSEYGWIRFAHSWHSKPSQFNNSSQEYKSSVLLLVWCLVAYCFFVPQLFITYGLVKNNVQLIIIGLIALLLLPLMVAVLSVLPVWFIRQYYILPSLQNEIKESIAKFSKFNGKKIVVIGPKKAKNTKKILSVFLERFGQVVYADYAKDMNSIAKFSKEIIGNERFMILEFHGDTDGDLASMCNQVSPDIVIITDVLKYQTSRYSSANKLIEDYKYAADFVDKSLLFVNGADRVIGSWSSNYFDTKSALGWKISEVKTKEHIHNFTISNPKNMYTIESMYPKSTIPIIAFSAAFISGFGHKISDINIDNLKIFSSKT